MWVCYDTCRYTEKILGLTCMWTDKSQTNTKHYHLQHSCRGLHICQDNRLWRVIFVIFVMDDIKGIKIDIRHTVLWQPAAAVVFVLAAAVRILDKPVQRQLVKRGWQLHTGLQIQRTRGTLSHKKKNMNIQWFNNIFLVLSTAQSTLHTHSYSTFSITHYSYTAVSACLPQGRGLGEPGIEPSTLWSVAEPLSISWATAGKITVF